MANTAETETIPDKPKQWLNPAQLQKNNVIDLRKAKVYYMATKYGVTLDVDISKFHIEKHYVNSPGVTLWECKHNHPRKVIRHGTKHF